jgi:hypothetical protein
MPRFFFDVRYGGASWKEDYEGTILNDAETAKNEAFVLARELAKEHMNADRIIAIRVRDGGPAPLLTLRLWMTVDDRPPDSN